MDKKLDFSGRTHLYFQLYDILYKQIKDGVYKPGDLLPTENELIKRYNISRVTVRKAMDLLINDGLIVRRQGYGTFVQSPKVEQTLNKVLHFSNEMEKRGYKSSTVMLNNEIVYANKSIAGALGLQERDKLININRLRYADGIPMCLESAYLIYENCPEVLGRDFSKESLRKYLITRYNINWSRAYQKIYAITATTEMAGHLNIKKGDPLIYIERVSYDQDNEPGEYLQAYYRGDSYYLTVELNAQSIETPK